LPRPPRHAALVFSPSLPPDEQTAGSI